MIRRILLSVGFCLGLFIMFPEISQAAYVVPSTVVSSDLTMTKAYSPYIAKSDVHILAGATLTIEPGVIIKMDDGVSFLAEGRIAAHGTKSEPIILTSLRDDVGGDDNNDALIEEWPFPGAWGGIVIKGDEAEVDYEYVDMRYAGAESVKDVLDDSVFENLDFGIMVAVEKAKRFSFVKSSIRDSRGYIAVGEVDDFVMNYTNILIPNYIDFNTNYSKDVGVVNIGDAVIDCTKNYWDHEAGPIRVYSSRAEEEDIKRVGVSGHVDFLSHLKEAFVFDEPKDPVLLIPGIMGSKLHKDTEEFEEVWLDLDRLAYSISDNHLDYLKMTEAGDSIMPVAPGDIVRGVAFAKDFFNGLIEELEDDGYVEGRDLFVFAYDWRQDTASLAGDPEMRGVGNLKDKIEEVLERTGKDKVDLVAHSMGGLIVKKYMHDYGEDLVGRFIDVGTPHLGAPKAFKILTYGDNMDVNFGIIGLNEDKAFDISQNMSSVYSLLPSEKYFEIETPSGFGKSYGGYLSDVYDINNDGIRGKLSYGEVSNFMSEMGRNEMMFKQVDNLHSEIDGYVPSSAVNIVGCGVATVGGVYILDEDKTGGYEYGLQFVSGDGTVPFFSALGMEARAGYVVGAKHSELPSYGNVEKVISSQLRGENISLGSYAGITTDMNDCKISGTQVSFHSPIELHIYDEQGRHTGPAGDRMDYEALGVVYEEVEGNKFAFLPEGFDYRIEGVATGIGSFDARVQKIQDGEYVEMAFFDDLDLSSLETRVSFYLGDNTPVSNVVIEVDEEGDGVFESSAEPDVVAIGESVLDYDKPETIVVVSGEKDGEGRYLSDVTVTFEAYDVSGIRETKYSLDAGVTWGDYEGEILIEYLAGQTLNFRYYSIDEVLNRETEQEIMLEFADNGMSIDELIKEINTYYVEGEFKNRSVRNGLTMILRQMKMSISSYEKMKVLRERLNNKMMDWCSRMRSEEYCVSKYEQRLEKRDKMSLSFLEKSLSRNEERFVRKLKFYQKRKWISDEIYVILNERLSNLIYDYE